MNALLRELVRPAGEERAALITPQQPHRFALPRAWNQFKSPSRWGDALKMSRTPHTETADRRPWAAALTVETARSADVLGRMRIWRDAYAPGVTTSAITFAAFAAALRDLGLDPDLSGATFIADARRYVATDVTIDSPRPRLTFSNQGRHDALADLPWAIEPAHRVNQSVPTLSGPEGITLTTSMMGGVLHLEATFHASTYDPALVARALQLVCMAPAALLMATR